MKRVTSHLLTKEKDSIILGRGNNHKGYLNKRAINKLQSVAWEIVTDIIDDIKDTIKPSDEPLTAYEEADRAHSFKVRDRETNTVVDYLLENGNRFFFGWKYDKRGRSYSQGYHVNPQGNEYRKAMLQFADKELLNEEGIRYLKIDIANTFGYDKDVWIKRVFKANGIIKDIFKAGAIDQVALEAYQGLADSPLLFRKAIYAYYRGVILGEPIGHNMGLDGTASGLQFMSALSGCCTTARNSNVHAKTTRKLTEEAQAELEALEEELNNI